MASSEIQGLAIFVVVGDLNVMKKAAKSVYSGHLAEYELKDLQGEVSFAEDAVNVVDPGPSLVDVVPGEPQDEGARKALKCIETAVELTKQISGGMPSAIVTAPVSKERIASVSPGFIGHTEYLQEAYSAKMVTMVLTGEKLCVVPVTRHIPLKDVVPGLSVDLVAETLIQVAENRFLISGNRNACIGVCALNPHCGEGGKIGTEEADIIIPAIEKAKAEYDNIKGPISADVIFGLALKKEIDIVVSMYHDQGLAPFKMIDFANGVNITLGLGHIRTSPDHGTAFDIAGKGIASPESMEQAIKLALRALSE